MITKVSETLILKKLVFFKVFLFSILLTFFYPLKVGFIRFDLPVGVLVTIIFLLYSDLKVKKDYFLYALTFLTMYTFLMFAFKDISRAEEYGYYFFRILRSFLFYYIIANILFLSNLAKDEILKLVFFALFFHVLFAFLQQFSYGSLRELAVSLNTAGDYNLEQYDLLNNVRVRGLFPGFDVAGAMMMFWMFFGLFIYKEKYKKYFIILVAFIGGIITSRIGIISFFYFIFIYSIFLFIASHNRKALTLKVLFNTSLFLLIVYQILLNFNDNATIQRAFEMYYNFIDYGSISTASSEDTLTNHYHFSMDRFHVLIGEPYRNEFAGSDASDVGYIQILYNFGYMISVIFFLSLLIYSVSLIKYKAWFPLNHFPIIFLFLVFILSFKGPYFFASGIFDMFLISVAILKYSKNG